MIPFRAQVKFFLDNPDSVDMSEFAGVFQKWIQRKSLNDGQLIDVADYSHVVEGPGIILIGHESEYAIENRNGRLGLLYTRKRQLEADLQSQLRTSLRLALAACQLLEGERAFRPALKFQADEIEIRFADRLQLPNRPETFDLIKDDLRVVLTGLYGTDAVNFAPVEHDPRYLFTVEGHSAGVTNISDLVQHLQASIEK
jgi:hypothetical protein